VISDVADRDTPATELPPGTYQGKIDRLTNDRLAIELDGRGRGNLAVRLQEGVGEFPQSSGSFSFAMGQTNLPYAIRGEHLVEETLLDSSSHSESCSTTASGSSFYSFGNGRHTVLTERLLASELSPCIDNSPPPVIVVPKSSSIPEG
jgi:hypothetical protein